MSYLSDVLSYHCHHISIEGGKGQCLPKLKASIYLPLHMLVSKPSTSLSCCQTPARYQPIDQQRTRTKRKKAKVSTKERNQTKKDEEVCRILPLWWVSMRKGNNRRGRRTFITSPIRQVDDPPSPRRRTVGHFILALPFRRGRQSCLETLHILLEHFHVVSSHLVGQGHSPSPRWQSPQEARPHPWGRQYHAHHPE